jgi:hypothetical protein
MVRSLARCGQYVLLPVLLRLVLTHLPLPRNMEVGAAIVVGLFTLWGALCSEVISGMKRVGPAIVLSALIVPGIFATACLVEFWTERVFYGDAHVSFWAVRWNEAVASLGCLVSGFACVTACAGAPSWGVRIASTGVALASGLLVLVLAAAVRPIGGDTILPHVALALAITAFGALHLGPRSR